jgi:hypothetical protein
MPNPSAVPDVSASGMLLELTLLLNSLTAAAPAATRPPPEAFTLVADAVEIGEVTAPIAFDPGTPATRASRKLLELAEHIDATATDVSYSHATKVRRKDGVYHFDCSGMINWMLERIDEEALETLGRARPVASTYVRTIQKAPTTRARNGWQRIADIENVEPGDLFAWKRPETWPKGGNTGHIGIVVARAAKVPYIEGAYLVRVIDSTRWQHQDDTRADDETGFGSGTILFMTDADRQPIGYAWHGIDSSGFYRTDVVFGRVH